MHRSSSLAAVLILCLVNFAIADEAKRVPAAYKKFEFRNVGPAAGGRVCRACGVPGDANVYYAATAAGGVWKSEDGGHRWKAITDDVDLASAGSIAVAPSDANVIYVGGGEANIRGNVEVGNGIWKSTDAGKTWKHVWKQEGQIGTVIVHPKDANVAFAAVLGRAFGPDGKGEQRGVYRTTDGGKTWKCVLFVDKDTGASDVCIDQNNPRILFAGTWQARRKPWEMTSGGPGGGLYRSDDGGDTWTKLVPKAEDDEEAPRGVKRCKGLPELDGKEKVWGKIGVAIARSDSQRIYALIEAEKGGLFRSDDGGETWDRVNPHRALQQRAWYYSTLTVHPTNADVVYFPQVPMLMTKDGGKTLLRIKGISHGDHHDFWLDPKNPDRMIVSHDGGVDVSTNGGKTWYAPPLPISQFYHVSVDNHLPYRIAGTMQDIGTARGPSNSLLSAGIPQSAWHPVGGGEAGHVVCDPHNPDVVYAGEYMGYVSRYDHRTRQARSIGIYPFNASGFGAEDLDYRFQWTAPIALSPHGDRKAPTIYHGANVLLMTKNDGKSWTKLSGDLTRNDRTKQKWSGGPITGDNTGVEVYGTLFAIAESPKKAGLIWVGSDDGLLHVTRDGGKNWDNVTAGLTKAGLPEWATICCIEPSRTDEATAYVVADSHKNDDRKPHLFVTTDGGKSWQSLTRNKFPELGYLQVVRVDPKDGKLLYVGGEYGLAFSRDGGANWERLKLNLPTVRVTDLVVKSDEKNDDLVVATNGRSIWVFDDLTALRTPPAEWKPMLKPRPVHRYRYSSLVADGPAGWHFPNPPAGAVLHYRLANKAKEVTLEVLDGKEVIRTFTSKKLVGSDPDVGAYSDARPPIEPLPTEAGQHRVKWDLRHRGAFTIEGARVDSGRPDLGPLVKPGDYVVRLTIDGKVHEEKVTVLPDPRLDDKVVKELPEQLTFALRIRDDVTGLSIAVEELRGVRKQLLDREKLLKGNAKAKELLAATTALVKELDGLEDRFHNPKAEVSYDVLAMKGGAKLYSQLAWYFELVKDSDGAPTQGVRGVHEKQSKLLKQYLEEWATLKKKLDSLNDDAKKLGLPTVLVPTIEVPPTDARPTETRKAKRFAK